MTLLQQRVLEWGETNRRDLPWRGTRDPWSILVAEVMLAQTQAARVVPRWERFLERWPSPITCASAALSDLLVEWQGLGYPRRCRDLRASAAQIVSLHGGCVPADLDALLSLPGVGQYTARAVQVFAFERDVGVVDTNIARILARCGGERLGASAAQRLADALVPEGDAWRWNQTVMDVGAPLSTDTALSDVSAPSRLLLGRWRVARSGEGERRGVAPSGPLRGIGASGPRADPRRAR